MNNYQAVNPYFVGDKPTVVSADSYLDAARKIWQEISKDAKIFTDNFAFSIQLLKSGEIKHFRVREFLNDDGIVDYKVEELDIQLDLQEEKHLKKKINFLQNGKQTGGRKRYKDYSDTPNDHDSDFDDDEDADDVAIEELFNSDEMYKMVINNRYGTVVPVGRPLLYVTYNPTLYRPEIVNLTFPSLTIPHILKIDMSSTAHKWLKGL